MIVLDMAAIGQVRSRALRDLWAVIEDDELPVCDHTDARMHLTIICSGPE
jgi:hypothetical protein